MSSFELNIESITIVETITHTNIRSRSVRINRRTAATIITLNASSVDVMVRVWTKTEDYWDVMFEVNELVYNTFNKEGIGFPFPQLTVHQAND